MRTTLTRLAALALITSCASTPPPAPPPPAAAAPTAVIAAEGPPLMIEDPSKNRDRVLATLSVPSIDRTMASLAAVLNQAQPGAYQPDMLRGMLLGQMGLPPALIEALDTAAPIGMAIVSNTVNADPGVTIAVGTRGAGSEAKALGGLGRELSRRGEARQIETVSGQKVWVQTLGGSLVVADAADSLSRGARVAIEARRSGDEDATMLLHPEAIARHRGTDVKTALAKAKADMREAQTALAAGKSDANIEAGNQLMDGVFDKLADAERVEVGLRVAQTTGVTAEGRFVPRAGSALAKDAGDMRPFEIEPGLLVNDNLAAVFGGSYGPLLLKQAELFKNKLARDKSPAAVQAVKLYEASLAAIDGRFGVAMRLKPSLNFELSYGLKEGPLAAKFEKELLATKKETLLAMLKSQAGDSLGEPGVTVKSEKLGKVRALHATIDFGAKTARVRDVAAVKQMFGDVKLEAYTAVVGKRVVGTIGENAKTRMLALAAGSPSPPDRDLAAALAESKDRDGFAYLDLGAFARLFAKIGNSPQAAMLGGFRARVPIFATYGGHPSGSYVSFALRIPVAAFTAVGGFLQMMAGGAQVN